MVLLQLAQPETAPLVPVRTPSRETEAVAGWDDELRAFYSVMQRFRSMEPDDVMRTLSGMSARMMEIRDLLVQNEGRQANKFRTARLDPFIDECDRQFRIHSRLLSVRNLDWEMSRG